MSEDMSDMLGFVVRKLCLKVVVTKFVNYFSLISIGTERSTIELGMKSIAGKAAARPNRAWKHAWTMRGRVVEYTQRLL